MRITRRKSLVLLTAAPALAVRAKAEDVQASEMALAVGPTSITAQERRRRAFALRRSAAIYQHDQPFPRKSHNPDEYLYPDRIGSYSKGLPHNQLGVVDPSAFDAMVRACETGSVDDFENIPMGGAAKLANPFGGTFAYAMEGADSHQFEIPGPPPLASGAAAGELMELYWRALCRDVPFEDYSSSPLVDEAAKELSAAVDYHPPKSGGRVTASTIFRGPSRGDLVGPHISQFLLLPINYGGNSIAQTWRSYPEGRDFGTSYSSWLAIQNGVPQPPTTRDAQGRYIHNQRELATYVHQDFSYQIFLNAGLILLSMGAAAARPDSYYSRSRTMAGFVTFGSPMVVDLVARVALAALKAAWCQKWSVYRKLRPEAMAGLVHNTLSGSMKAPIHEQILKSNALNRVRAKYDSFLLPQAYPEGSPLHPSYPGGHATIAGACITVLKALFNENGQFSRQVKASRDGLSLEDYTGSTLTIGGELDKLASNVAFGRDSAGIHYRSDEVDGILLGEEVALALLRECRLTLAEPITGFTLTRYDGTSVRI